MNNKPRDSNGNNNDKIKNDNPGNGGNDGGRRDPVKEPPSKGDGEKDLTIEFELPPSKPITGPKQ